jgi:hypothetical protein
MDTAQGQDVFGPRLTPKPARLFATGTDDGLAAGFDDAGANDEALTAEGALWHAGGIIHEIAQFLFHRSGSGLAQAFLAGLNQEFIHPVLGHWRVWATVRSMNRPASASNRWRLAMAACKPGASSAERRRLTFRPACQT